MALQIGNFEHMAPLSEARFPHRDLLGGKG